MSERRGRSAAAAIGIWLAVVVLGIVLATIGNVLREPLCVGGGSECGGARAPAHTIGNLLHFAGMAIVITSAVVIAGGFALRRRRR